MTNPCNTTKKDDPTAGDRNGAPEKTGESSDEKSNQGAGEQDKIQTIKKSRDAIDKWRATYYSERKKYCTYIMISAGSILLYAGDNNQISTAIVLLVFIVQSMFLAWALATSKKAHPPINEETHEGAKVEMRFVTERHKEMLGFERLSSVADVLCLVALSVAALVVFACEVNKNSDIVASARIDMIYSKSSSGTAKKSLDNCCDWICEKPISANGEK